jgi:hypothetical protein
VPIQRRRAAVLQDATALAKRATVFRANVWEKAPAERSGDAVSLPTAVQKLTDCN